MSSWGKVLVAGSGFLADAYALYIMGLVQSVIFQQYPAASKDEEKKLKSLITTAALIGAVIGQVFFGFLADRLGRKRVFVCTGSLIVVAAILSASAQEDLVQSWGPKQIFFQIAAAQLIMGFGIGGEYPLSATITSESASAETRGRTMALVFSMQGLGYLVASIVNLTLVAVGTSKEVTWRFCLGFSGVMPAISLYFRLRMHETTAFQRASAGSGSAPSQPTETAWMYRWHVLGTALSWFLFDIVFYANSLFHDDITSALGAGTLLLEARNTLIIVLIMLPGYWAAIASLDRLGRKNMQIVGFAMMTVLFLICGLAYQELKKVVWLFVLIYGLTFFFSNFGPNTTTYVVPGEIYPTRLKATCHGISAASGKAGAALGTFCFPFLNPSTPAGLQNAMLVCSATAVLGLLGTLVFTPRYKAQDLEPDEVDVVQGRTVHFVPLRLFKSDVSTSVVPVENTGPRNRAKPLLRQGEETTSSLSSACQ